MHREHSEAEAASCSRRCQTIMIAIHPTCYHLAINNCFAFILNSPLLQLRSNIVRELDLKKKQSNSAEAVERSVEDRHTRSSHDLPAQEAGALSKNHVPIEKLRETATKEENRDFKQNPRHQTDDSFQPSLHARQTGEAGCEHRASGLSKAA